MTRPLPLLVALALLAGCDADPAALGEPQDDRVVRVVRVVDGDTLVVGGGERVRLIGVDTPESVAPDRPVECFGRRAARLTERLVEGRRVRLELDREPRDRFDRLLAYVRRDGDGLFLNAELVRRGHATALEVAPNDRYADRLARLEREARRAGAGLWSACG